MKALVVDDEAPARDELAWLLDREEAITEVVGCDSATDALRLLHEQHFDVAFLDISMPGLSGVELASVLTRFREPPAIVFVTAHDQHAVDAFELRAVDYVVTAGAFAAFLSTSSGLTIALAGVLGQSLARRPGISGVAGFRWGAAIAVCVPLLVALAAPDVGLARAVGLAFAFAASTFCPLLTLGIWWRGLTDVGAIAGLLTGACAAGFAISWVLIDPPGRTWGAGWGEGWLDVVIGQPAAWCCPLAFAVMIGASRATAQRVRPGTLRFLARLHHPEHIG